MCFVCSLFQEHEILVIPVPVIPSWQEVKVQVSSLTDCWILKANIRRPISSESSVSEIPGLVSQGEIVTVGIEDHVAPASQERDAILQGDFPIGISKECCALPSLMLLNLLMVPFPSLFQVILKFQGKGSFQSHSC